MPKVALNFSLDMASPHEKAVYDALKSLPDDQSRRDYLVSAMLYYARSPSYLMALKLEDAYSQVETLASLIKSPRIKELVEVIETAGAVIKMDLAGLVSAAVKEAMAGIQFVPGTIAERDFGSVGMTDRSSEEYVDCPGLIENLLEQA